MSDNRRNALYSRSQTSKHLSFLTRNGSLWDQIIYCDAYVTNKTGSSLDDWIYYQLVMHSLIITLKHGQYSAMSRLHQLQFTDAHALGFSLSTSRLLAAEVDAQILTVLHSQYSMQIFFSQKQSSQLTPITHCEPMCTNLY
jgi:hypothetical protein